MTISKESLEALALTQREYEMIVKRLQREPNDLELGMFGSLWSEHCGYKHSKPLLSMLPAKAPQVLVEQGAENAGAVSIGDGLAVVFKIESHNHPSAIEPFQGAATGVGGIVRDIFAMGARPIALLNSLRFGPLTNATNRYLFEGVVSGISAYGNCIGVPDVGGEISFSPSYSGNPLVNAMCVGLIAEDDLVSSTTGEPGNTLMLVGADTGRDGIHGASGLASRTFEEDREMRPAVQVANPFLEKVLIEACLEVSNTEYVAGIQDLGAAGLTSAAVEVAAKGGKGLDIDVSLIPRRDQNMTPYEVMLSESQERMLVIVRRGFELQVKDIFEKWDLDASVIGSVTDDGMARVRDRNVECGSVPVEILTDPPTYRLKGVKADSLSEIQNYNLESIPIPTEPFEHLLIQLLTSPSIASKESVYRQYDHQVQTNTIVPPGSDAAVLRVKGTNKGIALTTDGNGRYCYLDPFVGGMIAVAEACRNLSCVGSEPIALTDCLNFGNPERPETYYQLEECVKGIAKAANALGVPVVSGNVSLYNESQGHPIYPTPVIGGLGLVGDVNRHSSFGLWKPNDEVILLGSAEVRGDSQDLSGSEYLELVHNLVVGKPVLNLELEIPVQAACRSLITEGIANSAHDCSDGGLAVALAELAIRGKSGFQGDFEPNGRLDAALFGEVQSRIIVSVQPDKLTLLEKVCDEWNVDWCRLGIAYGDSLTLRSLLHIKVTNLETAWVNALEQAFTGSLA